MSDVNPGLGRLLDMTTIQREVTFLVDSTVINVMDTRCLSNNHVINVQVVVSIGFSRFNIKGDADGFSGISVHWNYYLSPTGRNLIKNR